jgi:hypothetical protein
MEIFKESDRPKPWPPAGTKEFVWHSTTPEGVNILDHRVSLYDKLLEAIETLTDVKYVGPQKLIVGRIFLAAIDKLPQFHRATYGEDGSLPKCQAKDEHPVGRLGRWRVHLITNINPEKSAQGVICVSEDGVDSLVINIIP